MKHITIPLQDELDSALNAIAVEKASTKEKLAEEAVRDYVQLQQKAEIARQMREYAQSMAECSDEFVAETDALVDQQILKETEW